jgi:hypothetical protein
VVVELGGVGLVGVVGLLGVEAVGASEPPPPPQAARREASMAASKGRVMFMIRLEHLVSVFSIKNGL